MTENPQNSPKTEETEKVLIAPSKIFRTPEGELGIVWSDGARGSIPLRELRLACPCALCIDEHTGEKLLKPEQVPQNIALESLLSVGRYAAGFLWSDGHKTGIYPYPLLRKLTRVGKNSIFDAFSAF